MIVCRNKHPDDEVALVTSDTGLVLLSKARAEHFRVIALGDSLRLLAETDPVEEENRQLRQQLAEATATRVWPAGRR